MLNAWKSCSRTVIHTVLDVLRTRNPNSTDSHALLEEMIVQKQRSALLQTTDEQGRLGHVREI